MTDRLLPDLIQQMLQPGFYPHPVTEPIQLIQTHVSYVLLTGDLVYKLKKPVNFGFLDYSTLEKRQHFCAEEFRLNQRGASELYIEVLPITQSAQGQFQLNGLGEPVEYALKMHQFPQEQLFSALFAQGELTPALMENLGQVVAQFHAKAEINDYIRGFGQVEQIRKAIDENYQQTEKYIGGPQTPAQFQATKEYSDRFFIEQATVFTDRIQQNRIRECHGDLHLRNICLWQGLKSSDPETPTILLFDCIEFNEDFRFVDVMFDVAYAIMDLEAQQRQDLSNAYLNTYVETTGDWEGLQVLPLYLSRQAYVRAKVNSFLLDDPAIPDSVKQDASHTAAQYYQLAWQYTKPRQGQLFLMAGLSGSGKSTTARQLARRTGAIHIRSDAVRKHLGGVNLYDRGGDDLYTPEMTQKTYDRLQQLGLMLLKQGYSVILDAKYDRQLLRQGVIELAQAAQMPLQILHCSAPPDVLQTRLHQRTGDIADATADLLPQQYLEPFTPAEQTILKTIDTTHDIEQQLDQITSTLTPLHP